MVKRAVFVGVSYADSVYLPKVRGAENDVRKATSVLSAKFGFKEDDMRVLIDRPCQTYGRHCVVPPTKKNILEALDWLVCGASPGDDLFFHFSGHGSQLPAGLGCAGEGLVDDVLLPSDAGLGCDSAVSNCITADELKCKFARVPKGVTAVQVFDTGLGVAEACASSADKRGVFLGAWPSSKAPSFGGKTREQGKFASIAAASAAACDNAAMREVLFQWPSAWFAAAHGDAALESCFDGCIAGVFSHHFYDLLSSLEEPCLTNELLLSFVSRALRSAGYKQQPQFAAVDRGVDLLPILPVCLPSPPPPLPVSDCCLPPAGAVCPTPPADNGCDMKEPAPAPATECGRPEELLVGELVRLLGIAGFDVACRIQTGWSKMTVEARRKVYLELQSLGGVEAVKLGAELAADECFFKLVSEFGADAIYFGQAVGGTTTVAGGSASSAVAASDPDASPKPSTGEELGRCTWMFLHALADQYPDCPTAQQRRDVNDILDIMTRIYPCEGCADHFKQLLEDNPPRTSNGYEFQQWMCETHNVVNRKIGKPEYPCHKLVRRAHTSACLGGACAVKPAGAGAGAGAFKPAGAGACLGGACAYVRPAAAPAPKPAYVPPPKPAYVPPPKPAYVPPPPAMAKPSYVPPAAAPSPAAYVPPPPRKQVAAAAPPATLFAAPKASEPTKAPPPPSWQHSSTDPNWMPPSVARTPAYASDSYPFLRASNAAGPTRPSYEKKSSSAVKPAAPVTAPAAPAARRSCPYCPAGRA